MSSTVVAPENFFNVSKAIEDEVRTEGLCMEMCPREEVILRVKEKLVHILEVTRSGQRLVKSYCRSAADSNMAVPRLLRPFRVLLDTVHYLLLEISSKTNVKMSIVYDFLNDRLRSVRQDMTIQRLPPEECVVLLEPMIRFYVYYGYRLCDHPLREYDQVLNKKCLLECIKWFLNCCDTVNKPEEVRNDSDTIIGGFNSLHISRSRQGLSCDRILVECLYILYNLDDVHPLHRYLSLPTYLKRTPALKLAYDIAIANANGNYIRVLKLSNRLCPLTYAALCLYLPVLQRRALHVMSRAYSSSQLTLPAAVLRRWLAFNSYEEVKASCIHYGLRVVNETQGVCFNKASFKVDAQQAPLTKCFQAKILQLKLEEVLSYTV